MQIGKISEPSLKRSVLRPLFGDPALVRYRSGADCAQLPWQEDLLPVYSVVNEVPGFADDPGMRSRKAFLCRLCCRRSMRSSG